MKILKITLLLSLLVAYQSSFLIADELCDPDLSIENQKAKKITAQAQALLAKILKDKISLVWPVKVCECWVSSLFGPRKSGFHNGVDLAARQGTPVYAAADGIVEIAQKSSDPKGYGNMILLNHTKLSFYDDFGYKNYYKTRYGHLHTLLVKQGDSIEQGQQIGTVGATGHVVGKSAKADPSHLHFEVYRGEHRINPLTVLFAEDKNWVKANL